MAIFLSASPEQTEAIACEYAKSLKPGDVVILDGGMGAGKTQFVKGLARGLELSHPVTSPTYAYLNVYGNYLFHYDCYRLSSAEDAERLGLTDYFGENCICVVEWAERIAEAVPPYARRVTIRRISETEREISL